MRKYEYVLYYNTSAGSGNRIYGLRYKITGLTLRELEKQISEKNGRTTIITGMQLLRVTGRQ